jgi:acetylornithine deacetylase
MSIEKLNQEAVDLLKQLIAIPSFSREEQGTAQAILTFLQGRGIPATRKVNNVWARNRYYDPAKPTLLLNSHHDTVRPDKQYTLDPFHPVVEDGKLYGLGSNDAGGCLVALLATFLYFYEKKDLKYNIVIAASAEEEISGAGGIELLIPELGNIDCAIVGEPTLMEMAVAEKGLLVLDCVVEGKAGHAARSEGENAIYKAIQDIQWFSNYQFPEVSALLGPVKMSVTMINAGIQHNMVPALCNFTVDIRLNECYTHEAILEIIRSHVTCKVTPRSTRLRSTAIAPDHPLVTAGKGLGLKSFGSATLSDKALMPFPALKIGPGDSARSHTANEFIFLEEIKTGIATYVSLLEKMV